MKFRHLTWLSANSRPWVLGKRPVKDATLLRLIRKGYFPNKTLGPDPFLKSMDELKAQINASYGIKPEDLI